MSPENSSTTKFGDIALCLSGGGYRAAAFHLGTLKMLNELGLLENVKMLSTVSGGTIVGASYSVWRIEQKDVEKEELKENFKKSFLKDFKKFLKNENVIKEALIQLNEKRKLNSKGKTSVICEAANLYNEKLPFTNKKIFGSLFDSNGEVKAPFKELVFNATEFKKGGSFRFLAGKKNKVNGKERIIGNKFNEVPKDKAMKIRLGDIVAATSCFPGGFEPIIFPDDFEAMKSTINSFKPVSLMDGGIYDNQGIMSQLNSSKNFEAADVFIISDVSQRPIEMLKPHAEWKPKNFFISKITNLSLWKILTLKGLLGSTISFGYLAFCFYQIYQFFSIQSLNPTNIFYFLAIYIVPLLLSLCFFLLLSLLFVFTIFPKSIISLFTKLDLIKSFETQLFAFTRKMATRDLINLLGSRITSLTKMSSNVFMDRIRDLQNDFIMKNSKIRPKTAFNNIYALDVSKRVNELIAKDADLEPTQEMISISKKAEKVGTILWLEKKEDLKTLITCGEMTICFSLLEHLLLRKEIDPNDTNGDYYDDYQNIKKRFAEFKNLST